MEFKNIFSILRGTLFTSLSQLVCMLVGVLGLVITVYKFGVDGRGQYAVSYAVVSTYGLLFGWSLGRISLVNMKRVKLNAKDFFAECFFTILLCFLGLMVCAMMAFWLITHMFPSMIGEVKPLYLYIMFCSLPYAMWQYAGPFFFAQINEVSKQNIVVIINRALLMVYLYVLIIKFDLPIVYLFICFSVGNVVSFFLEVACFSYIVKPKLKFNFDLVRNIFSSGGLVHIESIFSYFVFTANVLFVNYMLGVSSAGMYSIVIQFHSLLFIVPTAGMMFLQRSIDSITWRKLRSESAIYMALCVVAALASIPFVFYTIKLVMVYSNKSDPGQELTVFYMFLGVLPSYLLMSLTQILNPVMLYLGLIWPLFKMTVLLSLINSVLLILCIDKWGIYGSLIAITFTALLKFMLYMYMLPSLFRWSSSDAKEEITVS